MTKYLSEKFQELIYIQSEDHKKIINVIEEEIKIIHTEQEGSSAAAAAKKDQGCSL